MRTFMKPAFVLGVSAALLASAASAAHAPPTNLRAQIEMELRTNEAIKIPANVDRTCVVNRALVEYSKVAKKVDLLFRLRLGKKLPPESDDGVARTKVALAAIAAIGPCTPKPAK